MMNNRYNELAIQAGGIWRGGHVEQPNGDSVWTEQKWVDPVDMDVELFTQLIVREMLQTCEDHPAWTGRMISEQIKQRFGVEE